MRASPTTPTLSRCALPQTNALLCCLPVTARAGLHAGHRDVDRRRRVRRRSRRVPSCPYHPTQLHRTDAAGCGGQAAERSARAVDGVHGKERVRREEGEDLEARQVRYPRQHLRLQRLKNRHPSLLPLLPPPSLCTFRAPDWARASPEASFRLVCGPYQ